MPFKYYQKHKKKHIKKAKYKIVNWPDYNKALINRGNLEIWLSPDIANWWYEQERIYDGSGAPFTYSSQAIAICYEVKLLFKLPLRQTQGLINSLFSLMRIDLKSPNYSRIARRLQSLELNKPGNKKIGNNNIVAIAIDSTGLKRFGRDEWHQEKHKISAKRSWRKLHIIVDNNNTIQACELTDKYKSDRSVVNSLLDQIEPGNINHITADGAYDSNNVYNTISKKHRRARIVIPPCKTVKEGKNQHIQRNESIRQINNHGLVSWQKLNNYGNRNKSETAIKRYKVIIGNKLHSRLIEHQKVEALIACGILNKMTNLGMPISQKIA